MSCCCVVGGGAFVVVLFRLIGKSSRFFRLGIRPVVCPTAIGVFFGLGGPGRKSAAPGVGNPLKIKLVCPPRPSPLHVCEIELGTRETRCSSFPPDCLCLLLILCNLHISTIFLGWELGSEKIARSCTQASAIVSKCCALVSALMEPLLEEVKAKGFHWQQFGQVIPLSVDRYELKQARLMYNCFKQKTVRQEHYQRSIRCV